MKKLESVSVVIASLVAVVTFLVGLWQFDQTQKLARDNLANEREMKAVELFVKFNDLQEKFSASAHVTPEVEYWRGNSMVAITESISNLTRGKSGWDFTVNWMIDVLAPFLLKNPPKCETYSDDFASLLKMKSNDLCTE